MLPNIRLKYYKKPENIDDIRLPGSVCSLCGKKDIVSGGAYYDKNGKVHHICEECAIHRYKEDFHYASLAEATSRRRRMFDVGYLFNEIVIDIYMETHGIPSFEKFKKVDRLFVLSGQLYNLLFTKKEKMKLEEIKNQDTIEKVIRKKLHAVDLRVFFKQLK